MNSITLSTLAGFPERLEAHYASIPAEFKHWAPPSWEGVPSEPFTPIEQICHIRDVEVDGYHARFRHMLVAQVAVLGFALDVKLDVPLIFRDVPVELALLFVRTGAAVRAAEGIVAPVKFRELSMGGRPLSSWPTESSPKHWLIGAM